MKYVVGLVTGVVISTETLLLVLAFNKMDDYLDEMETMSNMLAND